MPNPVKTGDGKLKGLTTPWLAASCPGVKELPGKSGETRKMGKYEKNE